MEERLDELGISWKDVIDRAKVSRQALLDIRRGDSVPRRDTRRRIERALELATGGFDQMQRDEKPTPAAVAPTAPASPSAPLAPLDEVLTASVAELAKLARLYAWYKAQREGRDANLADEERFILWAIDVRKRRRGIEPHEPGTRDVS